MLIFKTNFFFLKQIFGIIIYYHCLRQPKKPEKSFHLLYNAPQKLEIYNIHVKRESERGREREREGGHQFALIDPTKGSNLNLSM